MNIKDIKQSRVFFLLLLSCTDFSQLKFITIRDLGKDVHFIAMVVRIFNLLKKEINFSCFIVLRPGGTTIKSEMFKAQNEIEFARNWRTLEKSLSPLMLFYRTM